MLEGELKEELEKRRQGAEVARCGKMK